MGARGFKGGVKNVAGVRLFLLVLGGADIRRSEFRYTDKKMGVVGNTLDIAGTDSDYWERKGRFKKSATQDNEPEIVVKGTVTEAERAAEEAAKAIAKRHAQYDKLADKRVKKVVTPELVAHTNKPTSPSRVWTDEERYAPKRSNGKPVVSERIISNRKNIKWGK